MDSRVGHKLADRIPGTGRDEDIQPRVEEAKCSSEDTGCMDRT